VKCSEIKGHWRLTASAASVSVDVFFELDADLSLCWLIFDERMLQQLFCTWSHCIVFDQTHLNEVVKLLRPVQVKKTTVHAVCDLVQPDFDNSLKQ